jgi:hypothetical protein
MGAGVGWRGAGSPEKALGGYWKASDRKPREGPEINPQIYLLVNITSIMRR